MSTEIVYNFEFTDSFPLQLECTGPGIGNGFYVSDSAASALPKNISGYYTVSSAANAPCLAIDSTVKPGDYTFSAVIIKAYDGGNVWRSDGDKSKGHNVEGAGGLGAHSIGPITIVSSSFDMVDQFVGSLHVQFDGLDLCDGDCDTENHFIRLNEDDFDYINSSFELSRSGSPPGGGNGEKIEWLYTGFTKIYGAGDATPHEAHRAGYSTGTNGAAPHTGSGIHEPIVYKRQYPNSDYDCECDDDSEAGYAYVKAQLIKGACCEEGGGGLSADPYDARNEFVVNDDPCEGVPEKDKWDIFKLDYYTLGGDDESGNLYTIEWCHGDFYRFLSQAEFNNENEACAVSGLKIIAKEGVAYVEYQECGIGINEINDTPTPKPSCTVTFTPSSTASHTPTVTATHTDTPTETATISITATATESETSTPTPTETHVSPTVTQTDTPSPTGTISGDKRALLGLCLCDEFGEIITEDDGTSTDINGNPLDIGDFINATVIGIYLDESYGNISYAQAIGDNVISLEIDGERKCYTGPPWFNGRVTPEHGTQRTADEPDVPIITPLDQPSTSWYDWKYTYDSVNGDWKGWTVSQMNHMMAMDGLISETVYSSLAEVDPDYELYHECDECPTPTATDTSSPTSTATLSATPTITKSATTTPTSSATSTASGTPTETASGTSSSTQTATVTDTHTQTATVTDTHTPSATDTNTSSATETATVTDTHTPSATDTSTPSATDTSTPSATATASHTSHETATATATNIYVSPTDTSSPTATVTPAGCDYDVEVSLGWAEGGDYPDMDLYARAGTSGNAVYFSNGSDSSSDCNGWSLNFDTDVYPGCDEESGTPPEKITGTFKANQNLYVWFNQYSDCAPELGASNVTGSITFTNKGEDFFVNGVTVTGGTSYTFANQSFDYGGYNTSDIGDYNGGTLYSISGCADCDVATFTSTYTASATETATVTDTHTPSATDTNTSSATGTSTSSATPTSTLSATVTDTHTPSATGTSTSTPSATSTSSGTPTPTDICTECIEVSNTSGCDGDGLYEKAGVYNGKPYWTSRHPWTYDVGGFIWYSTSTSKWVLSGTLGGGSTGCGTSIESTNDEPCPYDATWSAGTFTANSTCTTGTATTTATGTSSHTPSATATATASHTPSVTASHTASVTASHTASVTGTASHTPTATATDPYTATPTATTTEMCADPSIHWQTDNDDPLGKAQNGGWVNGDLVYFYGAYCYEVTNATVANANPYTAPDALPSGWTERECCSTPTATATTTATGTSSHTPSATATDVYSGGGGGGGGGGCSAQYEDWDSSTQYSTSEMVCHNGTAFLCDSSVAEDGFCTIGVSPPNNTTEWVEQ